MFKYLWQSQTLYFFLKFELYKFFLLRLKTSTSKVISLQILHTLLQIVLDLDLVATK